MIGLDLVQANSARERYNCGIAIEVLVTRAGPRTSASGMRFE